MNTGAMLSIISMAGTAIVCSAHAYHVINEASSLHEMV